MNDTDAVKSCAIETQSVEEANTYTDQKMGEMNSKIKGVENKMSGGIASAMAMAGSPLKPAAPGANMTLGLPAVRLMVKVPSPLVSPW